MEESGVIQALLETNARLTDQIIELSKALVESRQPTYFQPQPMMESVQGPMWVPESEEDARDAFQRGLIDKTELENALKEIGFYNSEIEIPTP